MDKMLEKFSKCIWIAHEECKGNKLQRPCQQFFTLKSPFRVKRGLFTGIGQIPG